MSNFNNFLIKANNIHNNKYDVFLNELLNH